MRLYYFPSPNPQKVKFAMLELGLDCEMVPVDLSKGEQRQPEFLALNPFGRVPVLTDGELTLTESQAILAYLGDKTGRLWPASAGGRAAALQRLFFLSAHISPPATEIAFNRIAAKLLAAPSDESAIERGEKALPPLLQILEGQLAKTKWLFGNDFSLVDCGSRPVLNVLERAGFSYPDYPKLSAYRETTTRPSGMERDPKAADAVDCRSAIRRLRNLPHVSIGFVGGGAMVTKGSRR